MADQKLSALSEISVPALEDILYLVDDPAGTPAEAKVSANRLGGLLSPYPCTGRLTTESGVGDSITNRASQGTIYFTPWDGNRIALYDGTRWKLYSFSEISLSLTVTSGKNYDVFIYDNSGTLTPELSAEWTNDTTRADALTTQDGVWVKSGATTRRWVGTVRASGSNVTEDSNTSRFVWNLHNRLPRELTTGQVSNSHTYNTAAWREWNTGTSSTRLTFVCGLATRVMVGFHCLHRDGAIYGVGVTTVGPTFPVVSNAGTSNIRAGAATVFLVAAGFRELIPLEFGNAAPATLAEYANTTILWC